MSMIKEKPLRIGHVIGKMVGGGVEAMIMNYYRHINRDEIQFDFIIDSDSSKIPYDEIVSLGGRIYKVTPYQNLHQYNKDLLKVFQENNYKIVHSHINSLSIFPLRVAKTAGVPIRIAHSHSTAAPGETKKNLVKNILRPMSKVYPTHFFACSRAAGSWLFGNEILGDGHFHIVKNAIELEKFYFNKEERKQIRRDLGINSKYVIGHTGRLSFQKNQKFLIYLLPDIIKRQPSTLLLLLGDGPKKSELATLAQKLNVNDHILFLGNQNDVNRYYNAMDVFAFPSKYEGFGISAIEAQASGLPVVVSKEVPEEACLANNCKRLSLKGNKDLWIDMLTKEKLTFRQKDKTGYREFEIEENALFLEKLYQQILSERGLQ